MTRPIHIEGMGVVGCLLGRALEERGVEFTWSDANARASAWPASVGLVPPGNKGHEAWRRLLAAERETDTLTSLANSVEEVPYLSPGDTTLGHGMVTHADSAFAVSVPHLVAWSRVGISYRARLDVPEDARVVVAHGFNDRMERLQWGWCVPVQPDEMPGERAAYVVRRDTYLVPIAHDPTWYWAGGTLVSQPPTEAKPLKVTPKFEAWEKRIASIGVHVQYRDSFRAAWSPVPAKGDNALVREIDGRLMVLPAGMSGVTRAPLIVRSVLDHLEIA